MDFSRGARYLRLPEFARQFVIIDVNTSISTFNVVFKTLNDRDYHLSGEKERGYVPADLYP